MLQAKCSKYTFPGQGQKETWVADIDVTLQLIMLLKGPLPEKFLEDNIKLFRLFASGQIERIAEAAKALPRDNGLIDAIKEHESHEDGGVRIAAANYSMINCEEATARREKALAQLQITQNECAASAVMLQIANNDLLVSNSKTTCIVLECAAKNDAVNLAFAKEWLPFAKDVGEHDVFWCLTDGCRNILKRKSDEMSGVVIQGPISSEPVTPLRSQCPKTITEYLLSCNPPCRPDIGRSIKIGMDVRKLFDERYKGTKTIIKKPQSVGGKDIPVNVFYEEDWDLIRAAWRNTE